MVKKSYFYAILLAALSSHPAQANTSAACAALDGNIPNRKQFYGNNPTYIDLTETTQPWALSTPASEGVSLSSLQKAAATLTKRPEQFSFIVARNGKPIFERYFHGASVSSSNNVHSASKSILSAAIGIAIQEGFISGVDQDVDSLLPTKDQPILLEKKEDWKLRHLLTMTSGLNWVEDQTESKIEKSQDWVAAMLGLGLVSPPGTTFNYSTAMTHLLSVILTQSTGMSTCDYIRSRLLDKMGITPTRWDRDPQGYFSGGFNLYLTARDLARFGMLTLNQGQWNGEQIIPSSWESEATRFQTTDSDTDGYSYGYNWWLKTVSGHQVVIAWGFGGQFIYLVPDLSLMVVMTTNTRDYSSEATGENLLADYLIPAVSKSR